MSAETVSSVCVFSVFCLCFQCFQWCSRCWNISSHQRGAAESGSKGPVSIMSYKLQQILLILHFRAICILLLIQKEFNLWELQTNAASDVTNKTKKSQLLNRCFCAFRAPLRWIYLSSDMWSYTLCFEAVVRKIIGPSDKTHRLHWGGSNCFCIIMFSSTNLQPSPFLSLLKGWLVLEVASGRTYYSHLFYK